MKGHHPRITLLGNNSGRNLGDAAILSSILHGLSQELPTAEFYVPSLNPKWISRHYGHRYNVKAVNALPWTGSLRLLGIPTLRCLARSDVALICDGIIFGKKLFNPAFNYLITLIFLVPWAKLTGCKMVCYSCGIGPFHDWWSKRFARWVMNGSDLLLMRERDSMELARSVGVTKPIDLTGDAAFVNPVAPPERAEEIARHEGIDLDAPLLGVNVTSYVDSWLPKAERVRDRSAFIDSIAEGIRRAKKASNPPFETIVFSTHPMDEHACRRLAEGVGGKVITNTDYLSHDVQAMMQRCELFVGMRFHSIVLSAAVGVPVVGMIYAPKVRGFMRLVECERYGIELASLDPETLERCISAAWTERVHLRELQQGHVEGFKAGAHRASAMIGERYFPAARGPAASAETPKSRDAELVSERDGR